MIAFLMRRLRRRALYRAWARGELEFSGDDRANGRSWEAWVKRYEERRRLLAEGQDAPDIEPQAEDLG